MPHFVRTFVSGLLIIAMSGLGPTVAWGARNEPENCGCQELPATTLAVPGQTPVKPPVGFTVVSSGRIAPGVYRVEMENPSTGTKRFKEVLVDAAAREHVNERLNRVPGIRRSLARARRMIQGRGYEDPGAIIVARQWDEVGPNANASQQATASTSQGEIVAIASDDGNSATWEGTMYWENYSTGHWRTYNAQMWINGSLSSKWVDFVAGGAGGPGGPPQVAYDELMEVHGGMVVADAALELGVGPLGVLTAAGGLKEESDFEQFLECISWATLLTIGGCFFTGWWFWACLFLTNSVEAISCALQVAL